jgi:hypothetical protein
MFQIMRNYSTANYVIHYSVLCIRCMTSLHNQYFLSIRKRLGILQHYKIIYRYPIHYQTPQIRIHNDNRAKSIVNKTNSVGTAPKSIGQYLLVPPNNRYF